MALGLSAGRLRPRSLLSVESANSSVPTDEEAAAIVAAIDVLWPKAASGNAAVTRRPPVWRFSGRWWSQPIPLRRARPWM